MTVDAHIEISRNGNESSLIITEISEHYSGTYVFKAVNELGEATSQCHIGVNRKLNKAL